MADFGFTRLPAQAASGTVVFSRATPTQSAFIPLGTAVKTADGTETFLVTADPTNPAYSAAAGGYTIGAGVASLAVPVTAQTPGAAGNVLANTVTLLASALPGIDQVTNPAAFAGGMDAESDAAFRARFIAYINSRSLATPLAVAAAVEGLQQGLFYAIAENQDPSGATRLGFFTVTLDDGSGSPPASLLQAAGTAIEQVRPIGTSFAVQPPVKLSPTIALSLTLAPGTSLAQAQSAVSGAITAYVAGLGIGAPLPLTRIAQLAYDALPGVLNVSGVTIDGLAADLTPPANGVIRSPLVVVS
jgi:phage-related baseplate assembly protein